MSLRRVLQLVVFALVGLPVLYAAFVAVLAMRSGLSWTEMDANHDGGTSVTEFFAAADLGRRSVTVAGRTCTELFYLKDGMRAKLVCPAA